MITNPLVIIAIVLATILLVPMACRKVRMPSIVGFIIVGIIVGPYGAHLIDGGDAIQALGKIGMLYIMLQAGIEVDINDFRQQRTRSVIYGFYSFIFPFVLGLVTSLLLGFDGVTSVLMGAMYGSHTLMTYPIVSRYGVQKNPSVHIAIGGTMLSITLALLVLAILKSNFVYTGQLSAWRLIGRIVLTLILILGVFPWLAKRFFKRWSDATSGFLVVMTLMVFSALLADWAGLDGILGAFLCGVSLNRLVPNLSPVMQRINFVGNNLFVPLFLMGVGFMIDITLLWDGWMTIIIAIVMIATKLAGKWLAAWLAQKSFQLQPVERQLMFGLTHATAAGTLAIVTIGYESGIFSAEILNAAVLMILVLCTSDALRLFTVNVFHTKQSVEIEATCEAMGHFSDLKARWHGITDHSIQSLKLRLACFESGHGHSTADINANDTRHNTVFHCCSKPDWPNLAGMDIRHNSHFAVCETWVVDKRLDLDQRIVLSTVRIDDCRSIFTLKLFHSLSFFAPQDYQKAGAMSRGEVWQQLWYGGYEKRYRDP